MVTLKSAGLLAALALAFSAAAAAQTYPPVYSDWYPAVPLPSPVNTPGWQDSARISADGSTLYFTYFRMDLLLAEFYQILRLAGPVRPGWPTVYPYNEIGGQIYVAAQSNGVWQTPTNVGAPINNMMEDTGDVWISSDQQRMLYTNGTGTAAQVGGIYYAVKKSGVWGTPVLASSAGFPFVSGDQNPHLTLDENTLFFESSRAGGYGQSDIWMAKRASSTAAWGAPTNLGPNVNSIYTEGSPFSLDGQTLYFDNKGSSAIYRSVLQSNGTWSPRQVIVSGNVGDPSVTSSGDLYFCWAEQVLSSSGSLVGYNANVMVAHKK